MPNDEKQVVVVIRNARASAVRIGGAGIFGGETPDAGSTGIKGGVVLMPGTNEVPLKVWNANKDLPAVAGMISDGDLEPLGPEGEPAEFAKLKEPVALKAVRNCFTVKLLEQWASESKSPRIKKEIAGQLRMINDKIATAKKAAKRDDEPDEETTPEA